MPIAVNGSCGYVATGGKITAMSTILAIESSTDIASVALYLDGPLPRLLTRQVSGVQSHSESVLPMVQALLAEAGIALRDCDAIAFGAGPGSFTGVRTACGIVQGLAYGSERRVVAVDTLIAAAQACRDATGADDVLVVIDARMGQVYWGQYRWQDNVEGGGDWVPVVAARLDAPAAVVASGTVTACGNGFIAYAAAFAQNLAPGGFAHDARPDLMPHAAQVAALATRLFQRGAAVAARDAQPVYLRNDVALTTLERAIRRAEAAA